VNKQISTNDKIIRAALLAVLEKDIKKINLNDNHHSKIFEEFSISHGLARIDIAVINDILHGYEIKSDRDTLKRLSEQMNEYNDVFDKITLVVGKCHLYNAINIIPDWWGIVIAKIDINRNVVFHIIREADYNPEQKGVSIARLLWREEALRILESQNKATGFRSKPRNLIYERLVSVLDKETLKEMVKDTLLISRKDWRSDVQLMSCGD